MHRPGARWRLAAGLLALALHGGLAAETVRLSIAFLAQTRAVAAVAMFSGGWDRQPDGDIADWYGRTCQTPLARWHASFHVDEPQVEILARTYRRLGIPATQIHALDRPVQGRNAHGQGIHNPAYQALWNLMLALPP